MYWIWNSFSLLPASLFLGSDLSRRSTSILFSLVPKASSSALRSILASEYPSSELKLSQRQAVAGQLTSMGFQFEDQERIDWQSGKGTVRNQLDFYVVIFLPDNTQVNVHLRGGSQVPQGTKPRPKPSGNLANSRIPESLARYLASKEVIIPSSREYFVPSEMAKMLGSAVSTDIRLDQGRVYLRSPKAKVSAMQLATCLATSTGMYFRPIKSVWHLAPSPGDPRAFAREILRQECKDEGRSILSRLEEEGFLPEGTMAEDFLNDPALVSSLDAHDLGLLQSLLEANPDPKLADKLHDFLTQPGFRSACKVKLSCQCSQNVTLGAKQRSTGGEVGG